MKQLLKNKLDNTIMYGLFSYFILHTSYYMDYFFVCYFYVVIMYLHYREKDKQAETLNEGCMIS